MRVSEGGHSRSSARLEWQSGQARGRAYGPAVPQRCREDGFEGWGDEDYSDVDSEEESHCNVLMSESGRLDEVVSQERKKLVSGVRGAVRGEG